MTELTPNPETTALSAQPSNFTAEFTIKITGLRTQTVDNVQGVVKQVNWTLSGSEADQVFELPQTTTVPDPDTANFIPLDQLTESEVVAWIESHDIQLPGSKHHIQLILDRQVAQAALESTPMPWAPAPQSPTEG
jgi:hypothetical protein